MTHKERAAYAFGEWAAQEDMRLRETRARGIFGRMKAGIDQLAYRLKRGVLAELGVEPDATHFFKRARDGALADRNAEIAELRQALAERAEGIKPDRRHPARLSIPKTNARLRRLMARYPQAAHQTAAMAYRGANPETFDIWAGTQPNEEIKRIARRDRHEGDDQRGLRKIYRDELPKSPTGQAGAAPVAAPGSVRGSMRDSRQDTAPSLSALDLAILGAAAPDAGPETAASAADYLGGVNLAYKIEDADPAPERPSLARMAQESFLRPAARAHTLSVLSDGADAPRSDAFARRVDGMTTLGVTAAWGALAEDRPAPFPIPDDVRHEDLERELRGYRAFRDAVDRASADRHASATVPLATRDPDVAFALADTAPSNARPITAREAQDAANRIEALMLDLERAPDSFMFDGGRSMHQGVAVFEAVDRIARVGGDAAARGTARRALREDQIAFGGGLFSVIEPDRFREQMRAFAEYAIAEGAIERAELPDLLEAGEVVLRVTARVREGLDALHAVATAPVPDIAEARDAALAYRDLVADRRVEMIGLLEEARRKARADMVAEGFEFDGDDTTAFSTGDDTVAAAATRHPSYGRMEAALSDRRADMEAAGWRLSEIEALAAGGTRRVTVPVFLKDGLDLAVAAHVSADERSMRQAMFRPVSVGAGDAMQRPSKRHDHPPVPVAFFDPKNAAEAAERLSRTLPFENGRLADMTNSQAQKANLELRDIAVEIETKDLDAMVKARSENFRLEDMAALGYDTGNVLYVGVEDAVNPTLPLVGQVTAYQDETAVQSEYGEDYVPAYARMGTILDINHASYPPDAVEALRAFFEENRSALQENYGAYLHDAGHDEKDARDYGFDSVDDMIESLVDGLDYERFEQALREGTQHEFASYTTGDLDAYIAGYLAEAGYDGMKSTPVWASSREAYYTFSSPHLLELAFDRLAARRQEARAEKQALDDHRKAWESQHTEADLAAMRAEARQDAALFNVAHARADGFDIDRALWASVAHKDYAALERGEKTGETSAIRIYDSRMDAAAEGRDVAPVYLKTLRKPVFDLVGSDGDAVENRRLVVQALWSSAAFRDWMIGKGVETPEDFDAMIAKGDWARIPGQGAALMARVADTARGLDTTRQIDGPIRMVGVSGRPVYYVGDLADAIIARDALHRARVSGRSHTDTVGNPALTAAQRAARLARGDGAGRLDGRGARLLTHEGETILSALERAEDVRLVSGNDVVFFRGPGKDGADSFQIFDHDARRVAGADIAGLSVQEIEIGGDWTAQADITASDEMHRIAEALAAKGTAVSVAYLGSSGLEVARYGVDGSQERIPVTKELLETMKRAAAADAKARPSAAADSAENSAWAAKPLTERLSTLGAPMRNEVLAVRDGQEFVLSGTTAWRTAGVGPVPDGLEADPENRQDPVRLNAAAFADLGRLLSDRDLRLVVAAGPDRAAWSVWDKVHMETGRDDGPPSAGQANDGPAGQSATGPAARADEPPIPDSAEPPPSVAPTPEPSPQPAPKPMEAPQEGIPFVVTRRMRDELAARGYSEAQMRAMRPAEAQEILKAHPRRPDGPPATPDAAPAAPPREAAPTTPVQAATPEAAPEATPEVAPAATPVANPARPAEPVAARPPAAPTVGYAPVEPSPLPPTSGGIVSSGSIPPSAAYMGESMMTDDLMGAQMDPMAARGIAAADAVDKQIEAVLQRLEDIGAANADAGAITEALRDFDVPSALDPRRSDPVLNTLFHDEISAFTDRVWPLSNGYLLVRDPMLETFEIFDPEAFLGAVGMDGRYFGLPDFPPGLADRIADYTGAYAESLLSPPEMRQAMQDLRSEVLVLAREMNPNVDVRLVDRLFASGQDVIDSGATTGDRQPAAGLYWRSLGMAAISMDAARGDPVETMYHEMFHSIEGLLTDDERKALDAGLKGRKSAGSTPAERRAEGFARYAAERREIAKTETRLEERVDALKLEERAKGPLNKLWSFATRTNNALKGQGFKTFEEIAIANERNAIQERLDKTPQVKALDALTDRIVQGRIAERARVFDPAEPMDVAEAVKLATGVGAERLALNIENQSLSMDTEYRDYTLRVRSFAADPRNKSLVGVLRKEAGLRAGDDAGLADYLSKASVAKGGLEALEEKTKKSFFSINRPAATATERAIRQLEPPERQKIGGRVLIEALSRSGFTPAAIREGILGIGYASINDPRSLTPLNREMAQARDRELERSSSITPAHVASDFLRRRVEDALGDSLGQRTRLGDRGAIGKTPPPRGQAPRGWTGSGRAAPPVDLSKPHRLSQEVFKRHAPQLIQEETVQPRQYSGDQAYRKWTYIDPASGKAYTVNGKDAKIESLEKAAESFHFTSVRDAIERGAVVPRDALQAYPDLAARVQGYVTDDPRAARMAPALARAVREHYGIPTHARLARRPDGALAFALADERPPAAPGQEENVARPAGAAPTWRERVAECAVQHPRVAGMAGGAVVLGGLAAGTVAAQAALRGDNQRLAAHAEQSRAALAETIAAHDGPASGIREARLLHDYMEQVALSSDPATMLRDTLRLEAEGRATVDVAEGLRAVVTRAIAAADESGDFVAESLSGATAEQVRFAAMGVLEEHAALPLLNGSEIQDALRSIILSDSLQIPEAERVSPIDAFHQAMAAAQPAPDMMLAERIPSEIMAMIQNPAPSPAEQAYDAVTTKLGQWSSDAVTWLDRQGVDVDAVTDAFQQAQNLAFAVPEDVPRAVAAGTEGWIVADPADDRFTGVPTADEARALLDALPQALIAPAADAAFVEGAWSLDLEASERLFQAAAAGGRASRLSADAALTDLALSSEIDPEAVSGARALSAGLDAQDHGLRFAVVVDGKAEGDMKPLERFVALSDGQDAVQWRYDHERKAAVLRVGEDETRFDAAEIVSRRRDENRRDADMYVLRIATTGDDGLLRPVSAHTKLGDAVAAAHDAVSAETGGDILNRRVADMTAADRAAAETSLSRMRETARRETVADGYAILSPEQLTIRDAAVRAAQPDDLAALADRDAGEIVLAEDPDRTRRARVAEILADDPAARFERSRRRFVLDAKAESAEAIADTVGREVPDARGVALHVPRDEVDLVSTLGATHDKAADRWRVPEDHPAPHVFKPWRGPNARLTVAVQAREPSESKVLRFLRAGRSGETRPPRPMPTPEELRMGYERASKRLEQARLDGAERLLPPDAGLVEKARVGIAGRDAIAARRERDALGRAARRMGIDLTLAANRTAAGMEPDKPPRTSQPPPKQKKRARNRKRGGIEME